MEAKNIFGLIQDFEKTVTVVDYYTVIGSNPTTGELRCKSPRGVVKDYHKDWLKENIIPIEGFENRFKFKPRSDSTTEGWIMMA